MSFSDILDQTVPVRLLRNIIQTGRIPNGLLFWGPGGVGKHFTAMELAKAVNCLEDPLDACDRCLACRKVTNNTHPDVKRIIPSGKSRFIGVDIVDFMNELATYRPFEGKWRIFIIEEAERMREDAQNHFLKTLEEPPSNTVFVLLTEYPRRLLPTIRSRCQQVRFGALSPETVTDLLLKERDLPREVALALAAVSQGQMSRALDLVDSDKRDVVLDVTHRLAQGEDPLLLSEEFVAYLKRAGEAIKASVADDSAGDDPKAESREDREEQKQEQMALVEALVRRDMMEYLYLFEAWYRDVIAYANTGDGVHVLNRDQLNRLQQEPGGKGDKLAAIEQAWLYIERNLNIDRVFRDLFFALAA
jgi:DNA polymerase-3 subunit delta'